MGTMRQGHIPTQIQQPQVKLNSKEKEAFEQSSSSRSSSYSPPSTVNSIVPRIMDRPCVNALESSLPNKDPRQATPDVSEGSDSSPDVPWNPHRSGTEINPWVIESSSEDEDEDSDEDIVQDTLDDANLCDNYGCNDLHHRDNCPLPKVCWGCRSSIHFWTGCRMTCVKCKSARHKSDFCDDFIFPEGQALAYPSQLWRKKQIQVESVSKRISLSKRFSPATCKNQNPAPYKMVGDCYRPRYRHPSTFKSFRPSSIIDRYRPSESSTLPRLIVPTAPKADLRNQNKIYCEYWLRTGRCSFEDTHNGCRYKHEKPDEWTLREMGIYNLPAVVEQKVSLQQPASTQKALIKSIPKPVTQAEQPPPFVSEAINLQSQSKPPQVPSMTSTTTSRPPSRYSYKPSSSRSSPPSLPAGLHQGVHPSLDSVADSSKSNKAETFSSPKLEIPARINIKSDIQLPKRKLKSFEQEEELNQIRHELHMKRKKEEKELRDAEMAAEYNHKKRMKEAGF